MSRPLGLKRPKLTLVQERRAYDAATRRDQGQCVRCGRWGSVERDHRQGRDPFNTVVENLQCLGGPFHCGCHRWKTEHPREAIAEGFTVPSWGDPATWPARRHGIGWVIYLPAQDADGNWWRRITDDEAAALMKQLWE